MASSESNDLLSELKRLQDMQTEVENNPSSNLLAEIKRLRPDLVGETKPAAPTASANFIDQSAVADEVSALVPNLYQVAANANVPGIDTSQMGPVEQMLRSGDAQGLQAKLGQDLAQGLLAQYQKAQSQVQADRSTDRSIAQVLSDGGLGVIDSLGATVLGLSTLAAQPTPNWFVPEDSPLRTGKTLQQYRELFQPLYSDELKARRRANDALNAQREEETRREAEQAWANGNPSAISDLAIAARRMGKDAWYAGSNLIQDPMLLTQGTFEAAASMLSAAYVQKSLASIGQVAVRGSLQRLEKEALTKELGRLAAEGVDAQVAKAAANLSARNVALEAAKQFEKKTERIFAGTAVGLTEGAGGFEQAASNVLNADPVRLLDSSPKFYAEVERLKAEEPWLSEETIYQKAKNTLASRAGQSAALLTGVGSAAIGALFPENVLSPTKGKSAAKTALGSVAKDALKETAEEGGQSLSGSLVGNLTNQRYVDQNQDMLANVGTETGAGAVLGGFSVGAMKGPGLARQLATSKAKTASSQSAEIGNNRNTDDGGDGGGPGNFITNRADQLRNEMMTSSPGTLPNLSAEAKSLAAAPDANANLQAYAKTVADAVDDPVAKQAATDKLISLYDAPVVMELPASVQSALPTLAPEIQAQLKPQMDRATAVNVVAEAYNQETDAGKKAQLGLALTELLQPVQEFKSLPRELQPLLNGQDSSSQQDVLRRQKHLQRIEMLPTVQQAQQTLPQVMSQQAEQTVAQLTPETIQGPAGLAAAQTLATQAMTDPSLGGKVTSDQVEQIYLAHGTGGTNSLTEKQRNALQASRVALRALENAAKLRTGNNPEAAQQIMDAHVLGQKDMASVGQQATIEMSQKYIENGKFSGKQHVSRIINRILAGDWTRARAFMVRYGNFIQSENNKLKALNDAYTTGQDQSYLQYDPTANEPNRFLDSASNPKSRFPKMFVRLDPKNIAKSMKLAQTIDTEANFLTNFYNDLRQAFPELNAPAIENAALHPDLATGPADSNEMLARQSKLRQQNIIARREAGIAGARAQESQTQAQTQAPAQVQTPNATDTTVESPVPQQQQQSTDRNSSADTNNSVTTEATAPPSVEAQSVIAPTEQQTETAPVRDPTKTSLKKLYPNLDRSSNKPVDGYFNRVFKPAVTKTGEFMSRLMGADDPVGTISAAIDAAPVEPEIRRAYQKLLSITPGLKKRMENYLARGKPAKLAGDLQNVGGIATAMQLQLSKFLQEEWKKGITWEQAIREGLTNVTSMSVGKAINLVEVRGTGSDAKLAYNLELLTTGILAGLQWHLVTSTRAKRSFDSKVTDDAVMDDPGQETDLSEGMSTAEAKNSLAKYLARFWGIQGDPKEGIGFTDGLPEAFAAELIRALQTVQLVKVTPVISRDPETGNVVDTTDRYFSVPWDEDVNGQRIEDHPLYQQPDLLEELVVVEPEQRYFWGTEGESAKVPVKETQHSNPNVQLSAKTKQAVRNMQQQQFFMNLTMWKALSGLTEDQIVQLFGYELPANAEQFMNKMDLDAKQGANVALRGAFKQFQRDLQQMERIAAEKNIPVEQVARQYQYGVTAVNRFMMLGSYNPQANKLMRELMMPTWATLDASEGSQGYQHMLLAVAQALGRKVHTFALTGNEKSNVAWMQQQMEGPLKPVLDLLVRHLEQKDQPFSAGDYMAAMDAVRIDGKKLDGSPLMMMALLELARWRQLENNPEARKQFRTPLYLEADGMTNGPFNSIGLLSTGRITVEQLQAAARGGLNVSSTAITADQSVDKDNYQASMDAARVTVSQTSARIAETGPQFTNVTDSTFNVLGLLLGGEVKRDKAGNVTLTRAFGKNPITVLIYGSGVKGVAGKVADRLTKAFYEKLSLLAQAQGEGLSGREALARMFPEENDPAVASAQGLQLLRALQNTMSERLWYDRKKGQYRLDTRFPSNLLQRVKANPQNFEFTAEEIDALQTNLRHLVISPMYAGIQQTIGETVFQSRELLVQATKIHANTARLMFYKAIDAKMQAKAAAKAAELKKARPQADAKALETEAKNFVSNEFLSREELSQIIDELGKIMPMVSSDQQNFMIAKNQLLAFVDSKGKPAEKYITSRAFDDTMRTTPAIKAVADPAVAGVPYMVIGMGDGRMVRQIFENLMGNTMQVYDGINIPLDKVQEYGNRINQAALHAWQGNIFRDIQTSYYEMFKDPRVMQSLLTDDRFVQAMDAVIFPWNQETDVQKARERLIKSFKQTYGQLRQATLEIQARRVAFSRFSISMDQMSSTYAPHVTEGKLELPAELGARDFEPREKLLNAEYEKVLAQLQAGEWIEPEVRVSMRAAALDVAPMATALVTETAANPNQDADTNTLATLESEPKPAPAELPGKDLQEPAEAPAPGQQPLPTEVLARARDMHPSGVKIAGIENLSDLVQTLKDSLLPSEQQVMENLLRSKLLQGVKIVSGTREQVQQYQDIENQSSLASITQKHANKQLFGFYDPTAHTIFLMNPKVETLLHELVHAGTYALVEAHYQGRAVPAESQAAIQRLETLMQAFMQTDHGLDPDSAVGRALQNAQNEISRHQPVLDDPSPAQKAAMLNEFMAWTLSNRNLAEQLAQTAYDSENNQTVEVHYEEAVAAPQQKKSLLPTQLLKIWEAAKNAIQRLIGKRQDPPSGPGSGKKKVRPSILSEIQFNTAEIVSGTESISRMYQSNALAHAELTGLPVPARLEKIREAFNRAVARYLNQTYEAAWLQDLPTNPLIAKALMLAREVANTAVFHFQMDPLEQETFRTVVMAMATNARINPQSITELARVYNQFLKTVTMEDFLPDRETKDEAARFKAQKQFEFVTGLLTSQKDELGRSTALPVFLALGTVSEEFRQVLAKKTLALEAGQPIQGMDSLLDTLWQGGMALLEKRLSGMSRSGNMAEAIDQLNQQVVHEVLRTRNILENLQEKVQNGSHGLNSKMRKLFNRIGTGAYRQGQSLTGTNKSRFKRSLQSALTATAVLTSQQSADAVSEDFIDRMDKQPEMSHFLRELLGPDGLLGRTKSLGKVYDMVKKVRAVVDQSRQAYRKHLPFTVLSKFKMELSETQHDLVYRFAGRSDLASLLQLGRTTMDALQLVSDGTARKQEIQALEAQLTALVPDGRNLRLYQQKIQQLVKFMHTGKHGSNLLPNAHAIAGLFDTAKNLKNWQAPTEELIKTIDQLVTLHYLDQFSAQEQKEFALLVRSEPEGLEFTLSYLKGLHSSEMKKALNSQAKYNYVKGQLPSETNGGHLIVVADTPKKHLEMVELGYARVGDYVGSGLESSQMPLAYYFSADGGTETAINQGLIQNAQGTAYGVRTGSGFPTGSNAGFITDPDEVQELLGRMDSQPALGEDLLPVRNDKGEIIAFQRTLDPKLMQRLQKPQNVAQIIGHWAGRQMEESLAGTMNQELLKHLSDMYRRDIANNPENAKMYENVFASKDPIIQDMLRIMPKDLEKQIQQAFGEGNFFVRRSLLNQVIGSRQASVGDLWTGNTRYSPEFQKLAKDVLMAMFGKNAYRRLVWMEKNWQAFVSSRRTNIVVRSMVVPMANTMAGLYQLKVRGVPLAKIGKGVVRKLAEIEYYTQSMATKIRLEAELYAHENRPEKANAIRQQLASLEDSLKWLSIAPLIEAGEFSAIADVGTTREAVDGSSTTLMDRMEDQVYKLPAPLRDTARQLYLAQDTTLFQLLKKGVQNSDFIMKAVYYDHLLENEQELLEQNIGYFDALKEAKQQTALAPEAEKRARETIARNLVTEEFNNYDLPTGRNRGYLESMGLMWFLNYPIRATKIAFSIARNNPLDLLLFGLLPHPMAAGLPVTDNIYGKLFDGSLLRLTGPGLLTRPIANNAWYNLFGN